MTSTPPDALPKGRPRPARRGYLLPGAIALLVLAVIAAAINFTGLQHRTPHTLAGPDVATFVAQGIQSGAGDHRLPQVTCPRSEPVRAGWTFRCSEQPTAGGPRRAVQVTETDGAGTFHWSLVPTGQ